VLWQQSEKDPHNVTNCECLSPETDADASDVIPHQSDSAATRPSTHQWYITHIHLVPHRKWNKRRSNDRRISEAISLDHFSNRQSSNTVFNLTILRCKGRS